MEKANIKAVEMVRKIRDKQHQQLKDKSWEQQIEFFKSQARLIAEEFRRKYPTRQKK